MLALHLQCNAAEDEVGFAAPEEEVPEGKQALASKELDLKVLK